MSLGRRLTLLLGAVSAAACAESAPAGRVVVFEFSAESDPGVPLEGVSITVDGRPVGRSNSRGLLRATISGQLGQPIRIEHDCPPGYRDPAEPKTLRLGDYRGIDSASFPAIQLAILCPPTSRLAVIVVRADNRAGLPVVLNERVVATTNASGVAHLSTTAAPGTELRLRLDTSEQRALVPRSPTHLLTMPDAHEVFFIDQSFKTTKQRPRPRRRRQRIIKIE